VFNSTIGNQQKIIGQTPTNLTYELKSTRRKSMYAFIPDAKTRKSATAKPSSQQHSVAADKRSSNTTTNVSSENAEEGIDRISTLPDNILARMHPHPIEYHRGHEMSNTWWCFISSPDYKLHCINDSDLWSGHLGL
jgi:hypothetical protein